MAATFAFQTTSQILPMRIDPIPLQEISQRLGLKEHKKSNSNNTNNNIGDRSSLSIGSGPNMKYTLSNEHEVICPVSGSHQGILCTANLPTSSSHDNANSIANNRELVSQAILAGSLAASVRNHNPDTSSMYYLPFIVTLVESLMADEMNSVDLSQMVFNSDGLETNEILMDWNSYDDDNISCESEECSVMLFAVNTLNDAKNNCATSDVYVLPPPNLNEEGKVWRFCIEYKVATINLSQIKSFGDRDSTTPLRPDVWMKDDYW